MSRHPAARGFVMLTAWVEPELREYLRILAEDRGEPMSTTVILALLSGLKARDMDDLAKRLRAVRRARRA